MIASLYPHNESTTNAYDGFVEKEKVMPIDEALDIVKNYTKDLSPYSCTYDREGNATGAIVDSRAEFLLSLSTLIVYLVEKGDV